MAGTERKRRSAPKPVQGSPTPRIAPPVPARSLVDAYVAQATAIGVDLYPWQRTAARYQNAVRPDGRWLWREACFVVARQNGKTELLVPLIVQRLRMGRRIMHTAQNRELPREVHARIADLMAAHYPDELKHRGRGIRFGAGQEEINLTNGGHYRIVAPTRSGARGPANDDVIVDEVRELTDYGFIAAAKPTLTASSNPQFLYLSNAGEDDSVVLNALRDRADEDPGLAYLEWSAAPERAPDDVEGWREANPAMGHNPAVLEFLETEYRTNRLQGTMSIFETEHLCRWVSTMRERLVAEFDWAACRAPLRKPARPVLGVAMDPDGRRASVALAWRTGDAVSLRMLYDVTGSPIDTDRLGTDLKKTAATFGAPTIAFDPLTDRELVKYARKSKPVQGQEFANATAQFVNLVAARTLAWDDADAVSADLAWTARKADPGGAYHAVRLSDDRPITAALAAIRAVWLASGPRTARLGVY